MNEPMLHVLMDAIDDDLLEEAQRPLPARRPARRWGTLAACLCIAAALLVWQPWHTAGEAGTDSAAPTMDAALSAPTADTAAPAACNTMCASFFASFAAVASVFLAIPPAMCKNFLMVSPPSFYTSR